MLASANHGSTLAKLGKARISRINSWFQGVEPGQRVLDWLCLGSNGQWDLNQRYLDYDYATNGFYPFVLTGQGIDHKFYDFLNSYLVEKGSDGVVRVAGANMNYRFFALTQDTSVELDDKPTYALLASEGVKTPKPMPLGVYEEYSHSGDDMGIMKSIKDSDTNADVVVDILKCFKVNSAADYQSRSVELATKTAGQQQGKDRYCMLVINVHDDQGERLKENDYDVFFLAGNNYEAGELPKGFFQDKQMNDKTGRLVYYVNADKMGGIKDGKFGVRIVARPLKGFSYYCIGEYRSKTTPLENIFKANETTYVDITLHRFVDENVFRFDPASEGPRNFKKLKPSGKPVNNQ